MAKYVNPLRSHSDKKAKEFELGFEKEGIEYLIKMNNEVNAFIKEKGLKTKDYIKFKEEQQNGKEDTEKN